VRQLLQFDAVIAEVEEELLPNRLCSYLFELSQVFNRFYGQVPVLKTVGPARLSRLALCCLSAGTLKLGPGLLGIPSLERLGAWGLGVGSRQRARRVKTLSLSRLPVSGQHPLAP